MIVTARRHGGHGLIVLGIALTLLLAGTSSVNVEILRDGVGQRDSHPTTVSDARRDASLGIGHLNVDLTDLVVTPGEPVRLQYRVGIGELIVRVPADVGLAVNASARGGDIQILGRSVNGSNVSLPYTDRDFAASERKLVLDLTAGLASIQVVRAAG
jgi:predicted membrane protein